LRKKKQKGRKAIGEKKGQQTRKIPKVIRGVRTKTKVREEKKMKLEKTPGQGKAD